MESKKIGIIQNYGSASGGSAYEQMVAKAAQNIGEVIPIILKRRQWLPSYFANMLLGQKITQDPNILILTLNAAVGLNWKKHQHQKKILIWHHYDPLATTNNNTQRAFLYNQLYKKVLKNASKIDVLVVVGEYWRSFFAKYNFPQIKVIYNAFDLDFINNVKNTINTTAIRKKIGIKKNQRLIYIGQLQKMKSADRIWTALKHREDLFLIGSGQKNIELPIYHFSGNYKDYLTMLGTCDVALSMSQMYEGWNRTAHEAMLMGTPVIGNAIGNSGELLCGAKQKICHNFNNLPIVIEEVLKNKNILSKSALSYAQQEKFTQPFFKNQWESLIKDQL